MTKDEAVDACKQHATDIQTLSAIMAIAGISFATIGGAVEKGLGLPKDSLAEVLLVRQKQLISAISEYVAVLENAAKGQLAPVLEEWSEVILDE